MDTLQIVPQEPMPFLTCFAKAMSAFSQGPVLLNVDGMSPTTTKKTQRKAQRRIMPTPVRTLDVRSDSEFPPLSSTNSTPVGKSPAHEFARLDSRGGHNEISQVSEQTPILTTHATALLHVWQDAATPPSTFFSAVSTLLMAARLHPSTDNVDTSPFPPPGPLLKAYVRAVIRHLASTFATFPETFGAHFPPDLGLEQYKWLPGNEAAGLRLNKNNDAYEMQSFPTGAFIPRRAITGGHGKQTRTAAIYDVIDSVERSDDPHNDATPPVTRLRSNLEAAWDQFLVLYRQYRGEISTALESNLNQMDVLRTMAALHPANVDLFAARTISLLLRATRTPAHTPHRLRRLDERLSACPFPSPGPAANTMEAVTRDDEKKVTPLAKKTQVISLKELQATPTQSKTHVSRGGKNEIQSTVVLHRVPKAIRHAFAVEHSDAMFFLDFLTSVDSSRLAVALSPRLATAALHAVGVASRSKDNEGFTDAILESRLLVRLLGVCMHMANWPYSAYALSGAETNSSNADVSTGLSDHACMLRIPAAHAVAVSLLDIHTLISRAAASGELLAIIAAVCTADAALRAAGMDPVVRQTEWFSRGVSALAAVRVEDRAGTTLPIIRVIVGGCLQAEGVMPDDGVHLSAGISRVIYRASSAEIVGDVRFLRLFCPEIETLRKELIMFFSNSSLRTPATRRIIPLAKVSTTVDSQSKVRTREDEHGIEKENDKGATTRTGPKPRVGEGKRVDDNDNDDEDDDDDGLNGAGIVNDVRDDDCDNDGEGDGDDDGSDDDVQDQLRKEFIARVDGRIRELVHIVAAARSKGNEEDAHDTFIRAVQLLYPETPATVAAVAAGVCERRAKATRRMRQGNARDDSSKRPRRSDSPLHALEKGLHEANVTPTSTDSTANTFPARLSKS